MTTQSAVAQEMASKMQQFDAALADNGLTIDYLTKQLYSIISGSKSDQAKLSAITMLLRQQAILIDRQEVTVTDDLMKANEALDARIASRIAVNKEEADKDDTVLVDTIENIGTQG